MKATHTSLLMLCACSAGTTTTYPSSSGAMGVGASSVSVPYEPPVEPVDTGERDTGDPPEDSG